jgi:uncharacterized membrane protein
MEELALIFGIAVIGGLLVLVGLIVAITMAASRSARLAVVERDLKSAQSWLYQASERIAQLERGLTAAAGEIASLRREAHAARSRTEERLQAPVAAPVRTEEPAQAAVVAPAEPEPAQAPVAARDEAAAPMVAHREPAVPEWDKKDAPVAPANPIPEWPTPAAPLAAGAAPHANEAPTQPPRVAAPESEDDDAPKPPRVDWERWVGVRGAAALGACVLVIAGLYFFKYSIDQGLISPPMRVVLGALVGIAGVVASQWTLRRNYAILANWLGGAGVAILYTAFWAAHSYDVLGTPASYGLMIVTTVVCGALSVRNDSIVIALLGLLGGFATPLALSTGEDHPIGLFGYLLLLDSALLYLAHRRKWPTLGALSLLGTLFYQSAWLGARMDGDRLGIGIGVVLVFGGVYAFAMPKAADSKREYAPFTRFTSVLAPFSFGLYFGLRTDLGDHLYPIALMLCVLSAGAVWIARRQNEGWIAPVAAALVTAAMAGWLVRHDFEAVSWEVVALFALSAALFHGFLEWQEWRAREGYGPWIARAASIASLGGLGVLLLVACSNGTDPWPWRVAFVLLTTLALRQAAFEGRGALYLGVAILLGLGLPIVHIVHSQEAAFGSAAVHVGVLVALAAAFQGLAALQKDEAAREWASRAAAVFALLLLVDTLIDGSPSVPPAFVFAAMIALAFLALLSAARLASGVWMIAATLSVATIQALWIFMHVHGSADSSMAMTALAGLAVSTALFACFPFVVPGLLREARWAHRAAALGGAFAVLPAINAWDSAFGDQHEGAVALGFALVAVGGALVARRALAEEIDAKWSALGWLFGIAIGLVTLAVPLELHNEWITIAWAIEGAALVAIWTRIDHAGLKYAGGAHLAVATVRLVANPAVLDYHERGSIPILNWLATTYLVPAIALFAAGYLLSDRETPRGREWEARLYQKGRAIFAASCFGAAILVVFAWLNLTIVDAFGTGPTLHLFLDRMPARDLTLSFAWAIYALVLLAVGMRRGSAALRWTSLALVIATLGKVFLYDLANLKDLYRVASLVGLALSLIAISLAYQRFVFRKPSVPSAGSGA